MPTFDEWEATILSVVDYMVEISQSYPRVETQIFGQWDGIEKTKLQVI